MLSVKWFLLLRLAQLKATVVDMQPMCLKISVFSAWQHQKENHLVDSLSRVWIRRKGCTLWKGAVSNKTHPVSWSASVKQHYFFRPPLWSGLKYHNCWMDCRDIFCTYSRFPEDESYWLDADVSICYNAELRRRRWWTSYCTCLPSAC